MAVTIGTQADILLQNLMADVFMLQALGRLGTHLDFQGYEDFVSVVHHVTDNLGSRFDSLDVLLRRSVLPVVAHINVPFGAA